MRRLCLLAVLLCAAPCVANDTRLTPLVRAVQIAQESVVNIHSEKTAPGGDLIFSSGRDRKVSGMGTGIVIDERGYIVTNHHVVHEVDSLEVSLSQGNRYRARVISFDPEKDLAIIKIDARRDLTVMPLGTSTDLMLAETVFAVGNAFGYEHTVTSGIVSALSRDVEVNETQSYYNLIQTDASINPGNSGGPLLNLDGEVVGINVAIRAGAQRIGFAIPIDDARVTIASLLNPADLAGVTHGVRARDQKTANDQQLIVQTVASGSAAAQAGLRKGDVIVRAGQVTVRDNVDFARAFIDRTPGQKVPVEVRRDGKPVSVSLKLQKASGQEIARVTPSTKLASRRQETTTDRSWRILGVRLTSLSPEEKQTLTPRYRGGMKVVSVRASSPAAAKGLRPNDLLVGLHIWETLNEKDLAYVLAAEQLRKHNPLTFYIVRGGKTMFGQLPVESGR